MTNNYIPNTASIPNILFDYWMHKLSPAEFKVLMCIARKTYGFNKGLDRISIGQVEKMTGLSRKGITKNIDALMEYGLVNKFKSKTVDGDDAPNQYEINLNCQTLNDGNCMGGGSELSTLGGSELSTLGVVYSVHPQNPTYKTQCIQNNNSPPIPPQIPKKNLKQQATIVADERVECTHKDNLKKKALSDFPDEVKELAKKMTEALHAANPDWLIPKNLYPIMVQLDEMISKEKRDPKKILDVFMWAVCDSFWMDKLCKPNPVKYLRDKFAQLSGKMDAKPAPKPRKFAPSSNDARGLEKMKKWMEDAI